MLFQVGDKVKCNSVEIIRIFPFLNEEILTIKKSTYSEERVMFFLTFEGIKDKKISDGISEDCFELVLPNRKNRIENLFSE